MPVNQENMSLTELRHLARNEDTEVTIRFFVADQKTMPVKASKEKLIASSDYFAAHWLKVSSRKTLPYLGQTLLTARSIPEAP